MTKNNLIRTVLVGLGRIAQLYDYNLPKNKFILTHAQALTSDNRFDLIAGVDINSKLRQTFETKFDKLAFSDLSQLQEFLNPELVVIATPLKHKKK